MKQIEHQLELDLKPKLHFKYKNGFWHCYRDGKFLAKGKNLDEANIMAALAEMDVLPALEGWQDTDRRSTIPCIWPWC